MPWVQLKGTHRFPEPLAIRSVAVCCLMDYFNLTQRNHLLHRIRFRKAIQTTTEGHKHANVRAHIFPLVKSQFNFLTY